MDQYYSIYSSIVNTGNNDFVVNGVVDGQLDMGIILPQNENRFNFWKILSKWMVNGEILSVRF